MPGPTIAEPRLLLEQPARLGRGPAWILSFLLHVAATVALLWVPRSVFDSPERPPSSRIATPLIAPPRELTQRAENVGKASHEFTLEGLMARPRLVSPPGMAAVARTQAPLRPLPEPPKVEPPALAATPAPPLGTSLTATAPPPPAQIQTEEKPKLAFETLGVPTRRPSTGLMSSSRIFTPPGSAIDEAMRSAIHSSGGSVAVGDLDLPGAGSLGAGLSLPSSRGRPASAVELLSDPLGVDFKPYLIQVLAGVKRHWLAVYPESARMGRVGRVQILFVIARDGSVPHLVIGLSSGTRALDLAAVAGVDSSTPFPPLPDEFKGDQVKLQFTFTYNVK